MAAVIALAASVASASPADPTPLTATSATTASVTAKQTPLANFFKRAKMSNLVLSPNGRYIAAVVPIGERRNLAVLDLDTRKAWPVTNQSRQDIGSFMWANDDRLLVSLDNDGNEASGLFAVNRDGTKPEMLIEPAETQINAGSATLLTADVISLMESDPQRVLVSISRFTEDGVVQDVADGRPVEPHDRCRLHPACGREPAQFDRKDIDQNDRQKIERHGGQHHHARHDRPDHPPRAGPCQPRAKP